MGGGNNNNNGGNKSKNNENGEKTKSKKFTKEKFVGKCDELKGKVFDAAKYNQADEYNKVVEAIVEYVGVHFDKGTYVAEAIENKQLPTFTKPEPEKTIVQDANGDDVEVVSDVDKMIWSK